MSSRQTGAVVVLILAVLLAGCTGTLFSAEATPATIPTAAHESLSYVHGNTTAVPLTYGVGAAGISRNVTVTSWVSGYSRTTADNQTAALLVMSTPNVEVAGESINPFGRMADGVLVDRIVDAAASFGASERLDNVSNLRRLGASERIILDTPANVTTYAGNVDVDGNQTGVLVHVLALEHGDDIVVAVAVHPRSMDEGKTIHRLMERIEHETSGE